MQRVVTTNKEDEQDETVQEVLAVVLVGAMAVSMLTACGSASKTTKVKNALKNVGVKQDAAMVADTEKAMAGLQKVPRLTKQRQMTQQSSRSWRPCRAS